MKFRLLFLPVLLCSMQGAKSQTFGVRPIEGEFRVGATTPLGGFHDGDATSGVAMGMELRYNINKVKLPLDVGFAIDFRTTDYNFNVLENEETGEYSNEEQTNVTATIAVFTDYNFRQGKDINPFAGLGFGVSSNNVNNNGYVYGDGDETTSFALMPRVGVEFLSHCRLTASAIFTKKGYNNLGLTLGIVFGGGRKKVKR